MDDLATELGSQLVRKVTLNTGTLVTRLCVRDGKALLSDIALAGMPLHEIAVAREDAVNLRVRSPC